MSTSAITPSMMTNPSFLGIPSGTAARPAAAASTPAPGMGGPFTPQQFQFGFNGSGGTTGIQEELGEVGDTAQSNEANLMGESQGILDFASGNPQTSPLYNSLLNSSRSAISNSYDQAVSNVRSSAASRGFGYADPSEQGEEAGTRAQEAGALAEAPSQALQTTVGDEMTAAQLEANEASTYAGQEQQDLGDVSALQQSRNSKAAALNSSMMQLIGSLAGDAEKDDASQYGSI